ncbi:hypothetical protein [Streptomyces luteireticuli]
MNAIQQHMFDSYRALQQGVPAPPAPGTDEVRTVREILGWREFCRVLAGRVVRRRVLATRPASAASAPATARVPEAGRCR